MRGGCASGTRVERRRDSDNSQRAGERSSAPTGGQALPVLRGPAELLGLQRSLGNQVVGRLLDQPPGTIVQRGVDGQGSPGATLARPDEFEELLPDTSQRTAFM